MQEIYCVITFFVQQSVPTPALLALCDYNITFRDVNDAIIHAQTCSKYNNEWKTSTVRYMVEISTISNIVMVTLCTAFLWDNETVKNIYTVYNIQYILYI